MHTLRLKSLWAVRTNVRVSWRASLLFLGLLTHFAWPLAEPRVRLFDEAGYGPLVATYLTDQRPEVIGGNITDIHPPHAKMVTALVARLLGYRQDYAIGKNTEYASDFPLFALRFCAALCGVLIPFLFFSLARVAGIGELAAGLAAVGLSLDNAFVSHTRMLSVDGILMLSALGAFLAYFKSRASNPLLWVSVAGACAGLALGTKFTGACIGGFLTLAFLLREKSPSRAIIFSVCVVLVYLGGWWGHYFLTGGEGSFFHRILADHRDMMTFNHNVGTSHLSSSPWWSWPLGAGTIWLIQGEGAFPQLILCEIGNFVFRLGALIFLVLGIFRAIRTRDKNAAFWILAFLVSYFPFAFIGRYMFLYHYYVPLLFSLFVGATWLDSRLTVARFWDGCALLAVGFIVLSPLTFSFFGDGAVRQLIYDYVPYFW